MILCGVDEAGRGPLAGPVVAGAVVLPKDFPCHLLDDSKRMTPKDRYAVASLLRRSAACGVGWAWPEEIDRINIHHATLLAMIRAVRDLPLTPDLVLVDGRFLPALPVRCRAEVGGDRRIHEIMAASIIAKTQRDRWMDRYDRIEPCYRFCEHKGYATASHRFLVRLHGASPIHRASFKIS